MWDMRMQATISTVWNMVTLHRLKPGLQTLLRLKLAGFGTIISILLALCLPGFAQDQNANEGLNALVQVLGQTDDPQFQLDILKGMSEGLKGRKGVPMPTGWEAAANKLSQSPRTEVRELAQSLSVTFGSASALKALREKLIDPKQNVASRKAALDTLVDVKDAALPTILRDLLKDSAMRAFALRALAAFDDPKTPATILQLYPKLAGTEKREALNALVSRVSFARQLLAAVEKDAVPRHDLTADIVRQ